MSAFSCSIATVDVARKAGPVLAADLLLQSKLLVGGLLRDLRGLLRAFSGSTCN
tara:strand:+ start:203 stop:364 length:162 start_codon:yes stop_codon:yes gene_type:complete